MAISFVHFLAELLIAGIILRMVQYTWPDSPVGKALAVIY